ncbi:MAG: acyl-ACP thioesterase [Candidatus Adiutrix sp.]|jgi:fatty acyl-ACP thioesterase A|nr:acyl-ACP thioesterase [Candidatus Adiutrix sp.]
MNWIRVEKFKIRGYEIGPDLRVPLQNLCGYMEEAAALHAAELGFSVEELARRGLAWALARLWIEFDEWPSLGGEALEESSWVTVKTWPVSAERLHYRRDFLLTWRGRVSARAVTDWVVLNLGSRRAERMPEFITALTPEKPELVMEVDRPRLPGQENAPELALFPVRKSDLDRNDHVNNACLAAWLAESAPEELSSARRIKSLHIQYKAEARYGDTVAGRGAGDAEGAFLHGLFRLSDGQELVRARSVWADF